MDIAHYAQQLQHQLMTAAQTGTPKAREAAENLTSTIEPAVRLMLIDALSAAADEISAELAPAKVDLRLRGDHVEFVVTEPDAPGPRSRRGRSAARYVGWEA